jgi:hypothetical protein
MVEEPAKFLEYAPACREMVARMPDAQAKQKPLELAVAWEELARQAREPNRPFFESRDGQQKSLNQQPPGAFSRGVAAAPINFAATQASGGEKPNMSADEPSNPLAVFRVPPTQKQVVEHICEEIITQFPWRGQRTTRPRSLRSSKRHTGKWRGSWRSAVSRPAFECRRGGTPSRARRRELS